MVRLTGRGQRGLRWRRMEWYGERRSELKIAKFMVSGPQLPKSQVARQTVLPVMTGSVWMAYTLAKEMAWLAVDRAWSLAGVDEWQDWGPDEPVGEILDGGVLPVAVGDVKSRGCGTTQAAPKQARGGQGGGSVKNKGGKRKTPLPGITASQQSVREFFKLKLKEPVAGVSEGVVVKCAKLVPGLPEDKTGGEGPNVNSAELHGEGFQKNENILSIQNKDHSEYWRQKLYRFRAVLSEHSPEKQSLDNLKQK